MYLRAIAKYKPQGGLYLEGRFNGAFFALPDWVAYIWRVLFSEFYGIYRTRCNQFDVHRSCCLNSYDDDENCKDDDDGNQKKSRKKMAL